jgi:hypothetical protein
MSHAHQIVNNLLEADDFDSKAFVVNNHLYPNPKIKTTFSKITLRDDEGDYDEEHGYEDEEGQDVEVDEFDREDGLDVADVAAKWLLSKGANYEASSSHFHPGIWYSSQPEGDFATASETTYSFHLEGFSPEEEEKIFYKLFPRRNPQPPPQPL